MIINRITNIFNKIYNKRVIKRNKVIVDNSLVIKGKVCISGANISIGSNVKINSGKDYNTIGGDTRTTFVTIGNGKIRIGNNTGLSNVSIIARESVIIEDYVLLGGSVKIYDNDFHSLNSTIRESGNDNDIKTKPILIKNHAFIGAHSIILKGVTIGEYSIIGAGSVVTHDIPDGQIWAGNPAHYIKDIIDK